MMTWTCSNFTGYQSGCCAAVVTADDVTLACSRLEQALAARGLPQKVKPEQLIPYVTSTRYVRILTDGKVD
jgi:hypothetical protein